jgi:hypothetical protein
MGVDLPYPPWCKSVCIEQVPFLQRVSYRNLTRLLE